MSFFIEQEFTEVDSLLPLEYESCRFVGCDFSEKDFSKHRFIECEFVSCNLSLVKVDHSIIRQCTFQDCKLLGIRFDTCNGIDFSIRVKDSTLNYSTLSNLNLKKSRFENTNLIQVDFEGCDCSNIAFINCNLENAVFLNNNLQTADLRSSYNFSIDPLKNRIKNAKFSRDGALSLLSSFGIVIEEI
jgi:fluoroquinolone resistance protein